MNLVEIIREDLGIKLEPQIEPGIESIFLEKTKGYDRSKLYLRVGKSRTRRTVGKLFVFDVISQRLVKIFIEQKD